MKTQNKIKDDLKKTLNHISKIFDRLVTNTGRGKSFSFADTHKLTEGLVLSSWTHWEEFLRELLLLDVASDPKGALGSDVKKFRVKRAPLRIAERMINHPDYPDKYVNWDFDLVKSHANLLLSDSHRFRAELTNSSELPMIKRIRNGVAHKSDKAWISFKKLVQDPPFSLNASQLKGITVGRFLFSNTWNNVKALKNVLNRLSIWADELVP